MSKISYRDAAIKPMEFLNVRELQNTISKLKQKMSNLRNRLQSFVKNYFNSKVMMIAMKEVQ